MSDRAQQGCGGPIGVSTRTIVVYITAFTIAILAGGCGINTVSRHLVTPAQVRSAQHLPGVLKAHMRNGDLFAINEWHLDSTQTRVIGNGMHYDWNRALIDSGRQIVNLDSVVIFETNEVRTSASVAALAIVTVASVAISVVCLANPKSCFGSCPTFYVDDGDSLLLQAEGFSSSVSPALEATDIDALYRARFRGASATITMTNEAYETHVVRHADLLAVRKPPFGRAMATSQNEFWQVHETVVPESFTIGGREYNALVAEFDGDEWFSLADSVDLGAKETVDVSFPLKEGSQFGISIACRQSLMSTYLLYHTLAAMGSGVGDFFATLERRGPDTISEFRAFGEDLGNIEILIPDTSGSWQVAGVIRETGPLATDMHLLKLSTLKSPPQKVRIRLTKGYWRIDQIALVSIGTQVVPERIHPSSAHRNIGDDGTALASLLDDSKTLVTFPGDTIRLVYLLPQKPDDYEYFLETRGYYLEWMRENWLTQEDRQLASLILLDPRSALKSLAPEYKRVEEQMEQYFWNSRYAN